MNLLETGAALAALHERSGITHYHPTPPQYEWHTDASRVKLLRGPNQGGKTRANCAEAIWRCLGTHPYLETHRPPIESWILCHTWEQSVAIQTKFHELVPHDELDDAIFMPGKGYRGKVPVVRFRNGSLHRFKTQNQGALGLASATVHYVGIDEPCKRENWGEIAARCLRHGGVIGMTMTPINAPVDWIKKMVEEGQISDTHFELSEAMCTPAGEPPFINQSQIDAISRAYLPWEVDQRVRGAWEGIAVDRVFMAFQDHHVREEEPPGLHLMIGVGMDHGSIGESEVALLIAVDFEGAGSSPRIWILEEWVSEGATSPEQDAEAILAMLRRRGMDYTSPDTWVGDRRHGGRRWGGAKSNAMLRDALCQILKLPAGNLPFQIETAKKPPGSIDEGVKILQSAMLRDQFVVSPRCPKTIDALRYWAGADDDYKHKIDALRYGAITPIKRHSWGPGKVRLY